MALIGGGKGLGTRGIRGSGSVIGGGKGIVTPQNRLLLDQFGGAAAAYSIRLLSSTYVQGASGNPLLRVRRSSDNAEADVLPDSNNEVSLSSLTSAGSTLGTFVGANNGFVVTWYDQSGNSNNATTSTAANQPQIISSGSLITENGKPSIQNVSTDELPMTTNVRAYTSFFVHKQNAGSLISYIAGSTVPVLQGMFVGGSSVTGVGGFYNPTALTNAAGSDLTQAIYTFQSDGSTLQLAKDGSELASAGSLSGLHTNRIMGRNGVGAVTGLGEYQEIIIYSTDNASNKDAIEANINAYYSIY